MTSPTEPLSFISSNNCVVDMIWDEEVIPHNHHNSVYIEGGVVGHERSLGFAV
jgi:hypothetical protein